MLLVQSPSVQCPVNQCRKMKTSSSFHRGRALRKSNSCTQEFTLKTKQTNSKDNGESSILFSMTARLQVLTQLFFTKFTLPGVAVHVSYFYSMTAWSILREKKKAVSGGVGGVLAHLDFFVVVCLWFVPLFFLIKKWMEKHICICDCSRKCLTFFIITILQSMPLSCHTRN